MQDLPSPALRLLISNTAFFIRRDAAVVLCVTVCNGGVATYTGQTLVCTNVPTHVVIVIIGTFHILLADNLTPCISYVGGTIIGTLVNTRL